MARPKPATPANKQFSARITDEIEDLINKLVEIDAAEHDELTANKTQWFVRLVLREARYRRLLAETLPGHPAAPPTSGALATSRAKGPPPKP